MHSDLERPLGVRVARKLEPPVPGTRLEARSRVPQRGPTLATRLARPAPGSRASRSERRSVRAVSGTARRSAQPSARVKAPQSAALSVQPPAAQRLESTPAPPVSRSAD